MKKKEEKERAPRKSRARLVFKMVNEGRLYDKEGKEMALPVIAAVEKAFGKWKNAMTQFDWYLARNRTQRALGLPTDRLVPIPAGGRGKAAKTKKAAAKPKAKKAKAKAPAGKHEHKGDVVEA